MEPDDDLKHRFTYHRPVNDTQVQVFERIRDEGLVLARLIDTMTPDGREKSLAFTKVEEAVMWANAAVARNSAVYTDME